MENTIELTSEQLELIESNNWNKEAVQAYIELGIGDDDLSDFEEAYQGQWRSDEEFVQQLCEDTDDGSLKNLPPYIHIDWEWTAKEVMMDYSEQDGYYFRNL